MYDVGLRGAYGLLVRGGRGRWPSCEDDGGGGWVISVEVVVVDGGSWGALQ